MWTLPSPFCIITLGTSTGANGRDSSRRTATVDPTRNPVWPAATTPAAEFIVVRDAFPGLR